MDTPIIPHTDGFIHTHVHSHYSLLDGESSPKRLAERAKALGMPALCLTDHNHLLGVIDFKAACEEVGIQPILGMEAYYTDEMTMLAMTADERHSIALKKATEAGIVIPTKPKPTKKFVNELIKDYAYPVKQFHLLFLAKNETGYKNLVKLQSEASRLCTYNGRYLCDNRLIAQYKEGLIMTTACLGSRTAQLVIEDRTEEAEQLILQWHHLFADDFYLEIQPLLDSSQYLVNCFYIQMAEKHQLQLVATNDVHYATQADIDDHDSLLCIGTGKLKADSNRMHYQPEFWLRSEAEMEEAFKQQWELYHQADNQADHQAVYLKACKQAMANTMQIAAKCTNDYNLGANFSLFPKIEVPAPYTPERYLERICWERLYLYLKQHPECHKRTYEARLKEELDVINPKGFAPYMLVNQELISWCKSQKLPTGPGRGSAAGSLVLLLLGITKLVDPIKEKLLFSRFLTKDRTAMPDIDSDFSYKRRDEVIRHLQEQYGADNISHIGTISYMGVKSGLKDFARIFNMDFNTINAITSELDELMDYAPSYKFKHLDALAEEPRYQEKYARLQTIETEHANLFRLARKYEGTPRSMGVHASGILVMPVPVSNVFPTRQADGVQVCLFTGEQLDRFGSLKLDCLGLKTVDIINDTLISIDPNQTIYDFYDNCPVSFYQSKYFKDLCLGKSDAIFQLESGLFKGAMKEIMPRTIDDITAITALMRPGPLSAHMDKLYAQRKNGEEVWGEPLPNTLDLVKDTFGTIIYQEQPMLIAQRVAGFNGNQADSFLRKAMA